MNDGANEQLQIIKQAIAELAHCVSAGPEWFTQGEWGQKGHARTWTDKAMTAIAKLEELHGHRDE